MLKVTVDDRIRAYTQGVPSYIRRRRRIEERHNRYYPIEANLPIDVRTGRLLERGLPWRPLPSVSAADLLALSRAG